MREKIASYDNFEPFSIYRCIDVHKTGNIRPKMLQKYLLRKVSLNDCKDIIKSLSKPREPLVSFSLKNAENL